MFYAWVNKTFELGSKMIGMCGHGKPSNIWVRIADWFFIDCACCLFWRGGFVGSAVTSAVFILIIIGLVI